MSVARKPVEASTKSEAWLEEPGRRLSHKGGQEVVGFYPTLKVRLEQPEISVNKAIKRTLFIRLYNSTECAQRCVAFLHPPQAMDKSVSCLLLLHICWLLGHVGT